MQQLLKKSPFGSSFFLNNAIYFILLMILVIIGMADASFFTLSNMSSILTQCCTRIIFALGAAGIIILGGTDLSVGRQVGLAAVLACSLLQEPAYARRVFSGMSPLPVILPILLSMVVCGLISLAHGATVARWRIPPFVASLGVQEIAYGLCCLYYTQVAGATPIGGHDERLKSLVSTAFTAFGVSFNKLLIFAVLISVIVWIVWNKTVLGQNMYAIGGNREAARVSGVNVGFNIIVVYFIAGLLYGLGGALEGARTGSATNALGATYAMDAIAACVVGGVSMRGGTGTVQGVIIGVVIFQVINYGLIFIGMSPDLQYIVKGLITIFAVAVDTRKHFARS